MNTNKTAPAFARDNEDLKEALAFLEDVNAQEDVDYKWVTDYGKSLWEYYNKTFATLDEKAEAIVKYLGGGTGLFALGALAKVDATNNYIAWAALPAVLCALLAILLALRSKMPGAFPRLPAVRNAKDYADEFKEERAAMGAFLGQWNLACEKARLVCARKVVWITWATGLAYAALALLLLPLLVAIYWPH